MAALIVNVFRSAITGKDGAVDAGYLALFWLMIMVMNTIPCMVIGALIEMWLSASHTFNVQGLGVGVGAVCGGFATAVGAVGVFRRLDQEKAVPGTTTNTTATVVQTETK